MNTERAVYEARKGLHCLYIEAPSAVCDDLKALVEGALFALSWERMVFLAALTRLGSGEAFEISRALSFPMDNELRARMAYADAIASGYCPSHPVTTSASGSTETVVTPSDGDQIGQPSHPVSK